MTKQELEKVLEDMLAKVESAMNEHGLIGCILLGDPEDNHVVLGTNEVNPVHLYGILSESAEQIKQNIEEQLSEQARDN